MSRTPNQRAGWTCNIIKKKICTDFEDFLWVCTSLKRVPGNLFWIIFQDQQSLSTMNFLWSLANDEKLFKLSLDLWLIKRSTFRFRINLHRSTILFEMQTENEIHKFVEKILFMSSLKRLIIISTCRLLPFNPGFRQTIRLSSKFTEKCRIGV